MSDKPKMNLIGMNGNIYAVMGNASQLLKRNGQYEESKEMLERVQNSGSYHEALNIISEYVETEISVKTPTKSNKTKSEKRTHNER